LDAIKNNPTDMVDYNESEDEFVTASGPSKVTGIVYHGTGANFRNFSLNQAAQGIIWFTSDRSSIENGTAGASGRGWILECQVDIKKPAGWAEYDKYMLAQLKQDGYDGVILPKGGGEFDGFIFSPSQIRIVKRTPLDGKK
jgi:hypothetical protein